MQKERLCMYIIQVQYHIGDDWIAAWSITKLTREYSTSGWPISTIVVFVRDQAELMGLLNELHGHGMQLLSVRTAPYTHTLAQAQEITHGF